MGLENDEPTGQIDNVDVDAVLEGIEKGTNPAERPMSQTEKPDASAPATPQYPKEVELMYKGAPIKAPWEHVIQWAQQGRDYSQNMAELNKSKQTYDTERAEFDKSLGLYKNVDQYAKENPDWWKHVEQSWEQRAAQAAQGGQEDPKILALRKDLEDLKKFKSDYDSEKSALKEKTENETLDTEVQSIRKDFKDLDWVTVDANGQTLEQRVVKHAIDNDIKSFRTAFRDYNHEHLIKRAAEKAKEDVVKERQKQTKLGLLGQTPTPKKGISLAENVKTKSYEDLFREALQEEGIA